MRTVTFRVLDPERLQECGRQRSKGQTFQDCLFHLAFGQYDGDVTISVGHDRAPLSMAFDVRKDDGSRSLSGLIHWDSDAERFGVHT